MHDYLTIFNSVESSLINAGSRHLPSNQIRAKLDQYKHLEGRTFSDDEYYWILVCVIFYSGFKASTVTAKLGVLRKHFPNHATVAAYSEEDINRIINDADMISNRRKISSCVSNAKIFRDIVKQHGSFQNYMESFSPAASFENLMLLKEEIEYLFDGVGKITTYHFLTDIGMPVIKPDRVICRIFKRLGLIENEEQLLKTVIQGRKFAQATGYPIRYIDIVFVAYGQMESKEFGIQRGICLETSPSCNICSLHDFCQYYLNQHRIKGMS